MATLNLSNVPANITITNSTEEVKTLPVYPNNGEYVMNPGDALTYKVESSREYLFFYNTCKGLGLNLVEAE